MTPHVSATTRRFWDRQTELITDNIGRFARGERLRNLVDRRPLLRVAGYSGSDPSRDLTSSQILSSGSRSVPGMGSPRSRAMRSTSANRRPNFAVARSRAGAASMPARRATLTAAKSRSPTSSASRQPADPAPPTATRAATSFVSSRTFSRRRRGRSSRSPCPPQSPERRRPGSGRSHDRFGSWSGQWGGVGDDPCGWGVRTASRTINTSSPWIGRMAVPWGMACLPGVPSCQGSPAPNGACSCPGVCRGSAGGSADVGEAGGVPPVDSPAPNGACSCPGVAAEALGGHRPGAGHPLCHRRPFCLGLEAGVPLRAITPTRVLTAHAIGPFRHGRF